MTLALILAATYMLAEVAGGIFTGSLALLADAGHMLSDVIALSLGALALRLAQRPRTPQRTYGYHRSEILAALAQGALLIGVSVTIGLEALERFGSPNPVLGAPMLAIATGGLVVNLIGLAILSPGKDHNLNVRGAWLHVLSDALGSVGAMTAGALIWMFGWYWADPVASLVIAVLIIYSAWTLIRESLDILMETAPASIDVESLRRSVAAMAGVLAIHDLHVWTVHSGLVSLSGHVVVKDGSDHPGLLRDICDLLRNRFGIDHATIQIEPQDFEEPGAVCDD